MASISISTEGACQGCNAEQTLEIWLVVDADERPDLIRRICDGGMREFPCPRCGAVTVSPEPLMIYRPAQGAEKALLLTNVEHVTPDVKLERLGQYVGWLSREVGFPVSVATTLAVPWERLPMILARDFEADVRSPDHLIRLPADVADQYISMLHEIRHDRGLSKEGGRIIEY
jgi:hypothetical protein